MSNEKKRTPSDFLRQVLGRQVLVRLNNGETYRGTLACLDPRMNIALENTEQYENGKPIRVFGDTCIRGNNGIKSLYAHVCVEFYLHGHHKCSIRSQTPCSFVFSIVSVGVNLHKTKFVGNGRRRHEETTGGVRVGCV